MSSSTISSKASSPPATPTRQEVDAALKYIRSKTTSCKKDNISTSPTSAIIQVYDDKSKDVIHPPFTAEYIAPRSRNIHSSEDPDDRWNPCFDLPESSPTRVMSEMLRLAFTSQVSSKYISREESLLNTDTETMSAEEDSSDWLNINSEDSK